MGTTWEHAQLEFQKFLKIRITLLLSNVSVKFSMGEVKKVVQQIFEGLYYIHVNKILHRDMKAANILITKKGVLKLADFGLARAFSIKMENRYTNRVVTLW